MTNAKDFIPKMEHVVAGKLSYLKMVRRNKRIKMGELPPPQSLLETQPDVDKEGYTIVETLDSVWKKLHDRYVALRVRDFNIINGHIK